MTMLLALLCLLPLTVQAAQPSTPIDHAIAKKDRLTADIARDAHSRPWAILPHLKLKRGDRVVDIFGSGGYYSELMASLVGPEGEVLLLNNEGFRAWGINILNDRFNHRDPGNITRKMTSGESLQLASESLDAALMVMAFHDLYVIPKRYNGKEYVQVAEPADVKRFLAQVRAALKPSARFVVIDHNASTRISKDAAFELHRIHEDFTRAEIENSGFRFIRSTAALRNDDDTGVDIVFDPDVKGRTDRFVLVFEKPAR